MDVYFGLFDSVWCHDRRNGAHLECMLIMN